MKIYNVDFINSQGELDGTQIDINEHNSEDAEIIEIINVILSLKDEMDINEITDIEYIGDTDEEDY